LRVAFVRSEKLIAELSYLRVAFVRSEKLIAELS
jgi:hypothetical protein